MAKKTVAVFFGGKSLEHDVSILTGLQVLNAIDTTQYNVFPVYIDREGNWYYGAELADKRNYNLSDRLKRKLLKVELPMGKVFNGRPYLQPASKFIFSRKKKIFFDVAFPAFHGTKGEDGAIQGLFEFAQVPYTGPRVLCASAFMNKAFSKEIFRKNDVPALPDVVIQRPKMDETIDVKKLLKGHKINFPVCVKPCNLGSSVGVSKAKNQEELQTAILDIFKIDTAVVIEPFVNNLVEYNVAVTKVFGKTQASVIERPLTKGEMLDFKNKYLGNGAKKGGVKQSQGAKSEGMASTVREINPKGLDKKQTKLITESAIKIFNAVLGAGTPRIDFNCDKKTGKIWMNEVNTIPGSLAYYLWEASTPKVPFTKLITALIKEAFEQHQRSNMSLDLIKFGASIFPDRR